MLIYNLIIILLLIIYYFDCLSIVANNKDSITLKKSKKIIYFFSMSLLFFISAFREKNIGTDLSRYIPRFQIISNTHWNNLPRLSEYWSFEYSFTYLCKILSLFTKDYRIFLIFTSLVIIIGFYIFILKLSKMPLVSIFIFVTYGYWGNSMNIIRQSMAMSFLVCSYVYIIDKKNIKALLLILLASCIQVTSLFFIFILFFSKFKFDKIAFAFTSLISIIFFIIPKNILSFFISKTSFAWYMSMNGSGKTTLVILIFIFIFSYYKKNNIANKNVWLWSLSITIFFNVLALKIGIFERVMKLFLTSFFILIPEILFSYRKKRLYFIIIILCCIAFILYFYFIIMSTNSSSGGIIPYKTSFYK